MRACGVCRTDLHIVDGELAPHGPVVPGHEIVGVVEAIGPAVHSVALGERRGVPWLGGTCGACAYCRAGRENIPSFPYRLLWEERWLLSVANLTRQDALDFLPRAAAAGVRSTS